MPHDPSSNDLEDSGEITALLRKIVAGNEEARAALFEHIYSNLHRRARAQLRGERGGHTLQPTALVHEAYLRLFNGSAGPWNDRKHFLLTASRAMRHVLLDHARSKKTEKRDGNRVETPLDQIVLEYEDRALDLEALQCALVKLEDLDPEMARAVELRFFSGTTAKETARVLGLSIRTFERRWDATRAWLYGQVK